MASNERHEGGTSRVPGLVHDTGLARLEDVTGSGSQGSGGEVDRKVSLVRSVTWCVAAGLCAPLSPILVGLFGGYGLAQATRHEGAKRVIAACASLVAGDLVGALVMGATSGILSGVLGGASGFVAMAIAMGVCLAAARAEGRVRFNRLAACTLLGGLGFAGIGQLRAMVAGQNLPSMVDALIQGMASGASSLSQASALAALKPFLAGLWPTYFVTEGFVITALACLGAYVATRDRAKGHLGRYDVPLWIVGVLLAGIVSLVLAGIFPAGSFLFDPVGWNLILTARLAFAVQGFAVVEWILAKHHVRTLPRVLLFVVLAYLEVLFFAMSVIGVVDVWADFRHLRRAHASQKGDAE